MKKEYVKPQNRVVYVGLRLMETISPGNPEDPWGAKQNTIGVDEESSNGSDSSSDVWED